MPSQEATDLAIRISGEAEKRHRMSLTAVKGPLPLGSGPDELVFRIARSMVKRYKTTNYKGSAETWDRLDKALAKVERP